MVEHTNSEIAPCPFCGADCIVITANENDFAAACGFCRSFGPRNVSRNDAIAAWNTRHPPSIRNAVIEECAKVAESHDDQPANHDGTCAENIVQAIRALTQGKPD